MRKHNLEPFFGLLPPSPYPRPLMSGGGYPLPHLNVVPKLSKIKQNLKNSGLLTRKITFGSHNMISDILSDNSVGEIRLESTQNTLTGKIVSVCDENTL